MTDKDYNLLIQTLFRSWLDVRTMCPVCGKCPVQRDEHSPDCLLARWLDLYYAKEVEEWEKAARSND